MYADVWDAIEDSPAKAAEARARSAIFLAVRSQVRDWKVTRRTAARRLEVTAGKVRDLDEYRVDRFSFDALAKLAARAGVSITAHATRA